MFTHVGNTFNEFDELTITQDGRRFENCTFNNYYFRNLHSYSFDEKCKFKSLVFTLLPEDQNDNLVDFIMADCDRLKGANITLTKGQWDYLASKGIQFNADRVEEGEVCNRVIFCRVQISFNGVNQPAEVQELQESENMFEPKSQNSASAYLCKPKPLIMASVGTFAM